MLGHERLCAGVEVVHEDHGVVRKGLGREDLAQGDQVRVAQLLPLVHDVHALGVDEPVAVDSAEADVRAGLHVGGLVSHRGSFLHPLPKSPFIMIYEVEL